MSTSDPKDIWRALTNVFCHEELEFSIRSDGSWAKMCVVVKSLRTIEGEYEQILKQIKHTEHQF